MSILGSCKAAYLAWTIGWKAAILEDEDKSIEDVVEDGEVVGEDGSVKVGGGGKEGGGSLKVFNGVLMTKF